MALARLADAVWRFGLPNIGVRSVHQHVLPAPRSERPAISYPATEECQMNVILIALIPRGLAGGVSETIGN